MQLGLDTPGEFVSDGDLLTAWGSRMIMSSRSKTRPATILTVFDLRSRLVDTASAKGCYLQNLILGSSVYIPAAESWAATTSRIALSIRQALKEQATDAQARSLTRLMKSSTANVSVPLFATSDSMVIASTNWTKAKLREAANFTSAAAYLGSNSCSNSNRDNHLSYWGSPISKTDKPRDTFIIYGKNGRGDYWLHGYLRPETWQLIRDQFNEYT
jgi:hypothetical protein